MGENSPSQSDHGLLRALGLGDTVALVVGTIIGSGVFLVSADIARAVHGAGPMLAVWITGGFFTLLGAMSLAELGAAIPDAGGIYTFIARAFGPLAGFLCGWMLFTVGTSGSIATLAAALPIYIGGFVPLTPAAGKAVGIAAIAFFTAVNLFGVRHGARAQNALTVLNQMARDGLLFECFGRVHPRWRTPAEAILLQGVWSGLLVLFIGGFSQLFTYVIFGAWIFYGLAVAGVIVLRRREPDLPRPFRVPGYPAVPALFAAAAALLVASTLLATPRESLIGLAFIALGIPLYLLRRKKPSSETS